MKKLLFLIVGLVIIAGIVWMSLGTGTLSNIFMNKNKFENLVERFESPEREDWQRPNEVIAMLGDIKGKTIMDIGAGTGYYAFRLTAKGAKVIAADVDDRFIAYVEKKKERLKDDLIVTRKVDFEDPLLEDEEIHHAIIVNTYHHINNREAYFSKVHKGLKPGGSLMVLDFKKNVGGPGPPKRYRVATDKVQKELKEAGFMSFDVNKELLDGHYVVIAHKN